MISRIGPIDEVEGLRVGRFRSGLSTSCIVYRIGACVVDTGPSNQWSTVRRFLEERGVDRVLITHHHEDHSGNGARLGETFGARVHVPPHGLEPLKRGFPLRPYQRIVWGAPRPFLAESLPSEIQLEHGLRLRTVPAPGHSPDMTCFLEPNRGWLFGGDLYIASRPRVLRADESVHQQIESLHAVLQLDFSTLFCAHRGVVPDGRRAIQAKLDYLISLRDEVRTLARAGRSVRSITRALLGREEFMSFVTLFDFSKRHLIRACLADG